MKLYRGKVLYAIEVKLLSIQTRHKFKMLNVIPIITRKEISKYLKNVHKGNKNRSIQKKIN